MVNRKFMGLCATAILGLYLSASRSTPAQEASAPPSAQNTAHESNPLSDLSPENQALFDHLRESVNAGRDADVVNAGKRLLPVLKADTALSQFVIKVTANSEIETGDTVEALSLIKPFTDAHPDDWRAAAILVRCYAENGSKTLRDQQIAHLQAMHEKTTDEEFASLHIFPIQKVKLSSGYALFLYPFKPFGKFNIYLLALIYTNSDTEDYRIELESTDVDQAFFKPKNPGERRFSLDTIKPDKAHPDFPGSQALNGFIDGKFDYDSMRDQMLKIANQQQTQAQ